MQNVAPSHVTGLLRETTIRREKRPATPVSAVSESFWHEFSLCRAAIAAFNESRREIWPDARGTLMIMDDRLIIAALRVSLAIHFGRR